MVSVGFDRFGFSREEETKEGGFGFSLVWFGFLGRSYYRLTAKEERKGGWNPGRVKGRHEAEARVARKKPNLLLNYLKNGGEW